jgi:hypothetical protein
LPEKHISVDLYKNPHGAFSVEGKLTYFGPLKQKTNFPRIKLDITAHERVVLPPEKRSVFHSYSDKPAHAPLALSYCYEEIFTEKLRALAERARPRVVLKSQMKCCMIPTWFTIFLEKERAFLTNLGIVV